MERPVVLDFETLGIGPRPESYPPRPVGLAIQIPGTKPVYYAWGHPGGLRGNHPHAEAEARRLVEKVWSGKDPLLFHNAAFDLAVAARWWRLPWPQAERIEDTKILAFLGDPERKNLGLKPLAEELLGEKPTERDELRDWIVSYVPGATRKTWGAFISEAPGVLTSPYAIGDVSRTGKLWRRLRKVGREMPEAYLRERRLLRVMEEASERGMPVDRGELTRILEVSQHELERLEAALRKRLRAPSLDLDKRRDLADALERARLVGTWELTQKTQERKTDLDALSRTVSDPKVVKLLEQRSALKQRADVARTWEAISRKDGRVHTTWNTTPTWHASQRHKQGPEGSESWVSSLERQGGARTGRMSSTPNLQNIQKRDTTLRALVRAPRGRVLLGGDFAQQEFRILAHFEDGKLAQAYREDPNLDVHTRVQELVLETTGVDWGRDPLKTTGFGILYGRGVPAVAAALAISADQGYALRQHYHRALPGVRALDRELRALARKGKPIWTWGRRRYFCEKPQIEEGPYGPEIVRTFEYKLMNTLIQGSAADHLKETVLAFDAAGLHPILFVHDEIVCEEPKPGPSVEQFIEIMESVGPFRVPMRASGAKGATWADLK